MVSICYLYASNMLGVWELYCNYMGALFLFRKARKAENNPKLKDIIHRIGSP